MLTTLLKYMVFALTAKTISKYQQRRTALPINYKVERIPVQELENTIVSLQNVWFYMQQKPVLEDISFNLKEGSCTALIGPNGAGKTTLVKMILGLIKPDHGTVALFNQPPSGKRNLNHLIGYLPQRQQFDQGFPVSAHDVVMMGRISCIGFLRFPTKADKTAASETLRKIGFKDELINRPIGELSGGQQQLVFLARALCSHTKLLILDEPTNGLDMLAQKNFYQVVRNLQKSLGLTILIISHDISALATYTDQMICLNRKVYTYGATAEVLKSTQIGAAYGTSPLKVILEEESHGNTCL